MPWIDKDDIAKAREVNLLDYLPQSALIRHGRGYKLAEEHSLKIDADGKWYWWAEGIGGINALDFMIKYENKSFQEAVMELLDGNIRTASAERRAVPEINREKEQMKFTLPEKNNNNERVRRYLIEERGLEPHIVDYCIQKGIIYETKKYNNAVFVGVDENGTPKYAALRGTMKGSSFKGDVAASNKEYSFAIQGQGDLNQVEIFESAIDALSYASWLSLAINGGGSDNKDFWLSTNYLSLAGVYKYDENKKSRDEPKLPMALEKYIANHPEVKTINLHLDTDKVGIGAAELITKLINDKYPDIRISNGPPLSIETSQGTIDCKDWNEYLIEWRKDCGYIPKYSPVKPEIPVREFEIEITEVLSKKVVIKAASQEEAEKIAKSNYDQAKEGYVLGADDFADVSIKCTTPPIESRQKEVARKPSMRR